MTSDSNATITYNDFINGTSAVSHPSSFEMPSPCMAIAYETSLQKQHLFAGENFPTTVKTDCKSILELSNPSPLSGILKRDRR